MTHSSYLCIPKTSKEGFAVELLKIEGLQKKIGKKTIVKDLSLTVNSGEIVGFLGPNGAGKTTTIKMIMGLFRISAGTIRVCGHDIITDYEDAIRNVGGIVENPDLYKRMTGRQNLEYFASMYDGVDVKNIDDVVKLVKMSDRINDRVKTYSLGMCQRIGIAQALLHNPKLLVLDEPTNGLDPIGIKEMRDLLKYLSKNAGVGVFISSHLLSEMELMCDRIYIIDNGELIGEKAMSELNAHSDSDEFQYVLDTSDNAAAYAYLQELSTVSTLDGDGLTLEATRSLIPGIVRELVNRGIDIFAINQEHRTLEQDFLSMTTGSKTQIR